MMAHIHFKDTKRSELSLETSDSSNVTLVCGDGSLTSPSSRLLGMFSPVLRSTNHSNEMVILLPDFSKATVSTVMELVGMRWRGEKTISSKEKVLLAALGISILGALSEIKSKAIVKQTKTEPAQMKRGKAKPRIAAQRQPDPAIKTKLERTHSEINLAIASSKVKQILPFQCDLCDEKVPKTDLRTHCEKEHKDDIGEPSESEILSYFSPCPDLDISKTSSVEMAQSKVLDKSDSEPYKAPHFDISNAHKEEPTDHIKTKVGLQAKEIDVQIKPRPKSTNKIQTPLPSNAQQLKNVQIAPKVKSQTIKAKSTVPPQLTKKLTSTGVSVKKESERLKSPESVKESCGENKPQRQSESVKKSNSCEKSNIKVSSNTSTKDFSDDGLVQCPHCESKFARPNTSIAKFELRSHIGQSHYKEELLMEALRIFKENKCSLCEKMFKTKDQQVIHLLYNHTRWVEVIAAEADLAMERNVFSNREEGAVVKLVPTLGSDQAVKLAPTSKEAAIKLVPTSKLLSPQAKKEEDGKRTDKDRVEKVKKLEENAKKEAKEKVKNEVGKCIHCEKEFSGNNPDDISIHFLASHTAPNDSYFLASNQCIVCDVEVLPDDQNIHMMKMHDYMKSEIQSFIVQVIKNSTTPNVTNVRLMKSEPTSSMITSKVDKSLKDCPSTTPKKAPDSIADIQRKLLAIVGPQGVQDVEEEQQEEDKDMDSDPDFEDVVDDDEELEDMVADDLGVDKIKKETDVMEVEQELLKDIKSQRSSDDDEQDDKMKDTEDTLEDILNFKEEEVDEDLEEVYKDISDDEYCGENDEDEIEREINLMRQEESNDGTELDELV